MLWCRFIRNASHPSNGEKEYKLVDHFGSTRAVLDESGNVIGRYDNEPFGAPVAVAGVDTRKGFIDKENDAETSTSNHGVRQYDAETGRFTSVDPLWEKYLGMNPYYYSAGNPLVLVDKNGMPIDMLNIKFTDEVNNRNYTNEIINDPVLEFVLWCLLRKNGNC